MKRSVVIIVSVICIALAGYVGWKWFSHQTSATQSADGRGSNQHDASTVPVTIAVAQSGSMPVLRQTIGTIVPVASTAVSSPAAGIVATVAVKDGAEVKAGDLVVLLDDRAIRAAIGKDNAAIAKDQATLDDANISLNRISKLARTGVDTSQAEDDAVAAVKVAQAQIGVDQAQLAADNVSLANTRITAPFDGQLGIVQVSQGAFVSAGTAVATVTQMKPVYAEFSLAETDLALARNALARGELTAEVTPSRGNSAPKAATGTISFIDNNVDLSTGSFKLRATLANDDNSFWPGQSLNVQLAAGEQQNLILIPSVAVQPQENGSSTYVVKDDGTVEIRPVTVTSRINDMAGISQGLKAGEKVVTEGQGTLSANSRVTIVDNTKSAAAAGADTTAKETTTPKN
ncbi:MAG: efflux RND transporter periplasmic adaptor subunit [Brucellaceae bacterium]|nr:efflux RND transporter periplasmic adaptor subunit [Brucellaceae bacterium]